MNIMGAPIPKNLKDKVLTLYIDGLTRKLIAKKLKISTGSVSNILAEFQEEIPNLSLARTIGKLSNAQHWSIKELSSAVHFKKQLDYIGASEEETEQLIEYVNTYCFDQKLPIQEFIKTIFDVCDLSEKLVVPVRRLPSELVTMHKKVQEKQDTVAQMEKKYNVLFEQYGTTRNDLEQYNRDRPSLEEIRRLKLRNQTLQDKTRDLARCRVRLRQMESEMQISKTKQEWDAYNWGTPEGAIERIRVDGCNSLHVEDVYSAARDLFNDPGHYEDIIVALFLRHRQLRENANNST